MKIMSIETSCDETGVSVLEFNNPKDQPKILFETLSSQVDIHATTFGIVPEVASRIHSEILPKFLMDVDASIGLINIDYIATTTSPGLLGSLLVGNNFTRMLSYLYNKPILSVNHLLGHFYSPFINLPLSTLEFPALGLIVSGGHTMLVLAENKSKFKIIGETRDDAAGEAFDKVARLLNLGYPGGPAIATAAEKVKKSPFKFTAPMLKSGDFDFSYSGLKTQVRTTIEKQPKIDKQRQAEIAFSAQNAIVESLVQKAFLAVKKFQPTTFVLGGGVAANQLLRKKLVSELSIILPGDKIFIPERKYSTDNAAMIALAGYLGLPKNIVAWDKLQTSSSSNL